MTTTPAAPEGLYTPEEIRWQIGQATIRVIAHRGMHRWAAEDVAADAGLELRTVYEYFDARAALLEHAIAHLGRYHHLRPAGGSTADHLTQLMADQLGGDRGLAMPIILAALPLAPALRHAWADGPGRRQRAELAMITADIPVLRDRIEQLRDAFDDVLNAHRGRWLATGNPPHIGDIRRSATALLDRFTKVGARR